MATTSQQDAMDAHDLIEAQEFIDLIDRGGHLSNSYNKDAAAEEADSSSGNNRSSSPEEEEDQNGSRSEEASSTGDGFQASSPHHR